MRLFDLKKLLEPEKQKMGLFWGFLVLSKSGLFIDTMYQSNCKRFGRLGVKSCFTCIICLCERASKSHYETILDIPDEELAHLIQITKKVAGHLKKKLDAQGIRVSNNNYPAARQIVPHIHFHVIPITADNPVKFKRSNRIEMTTEEFEQLLSKIRIS